MIPSSNVMSIASSMSVTQHQLPFLEGSSSNSNDAASLVGKASYQHRLPALSNGGLPPGVREISNKKPMRPLTAYHIFFQIEREFVIQTTAGEDADKSIHDRKVYLNGVPRRYRNIKLLPDWYAGPGKRQKRKHRKQHGKIGFLELSQVISSRWARLEEIDPETKAFVLRIARQELDEYYREMEEYKEMMKGVLPEPAAKKSVSRPMAPKKKVTKKLSINSKSNNPSLPIQQQQQRQPFSLVSRLPEMVSSSCQSADFMHPGSFQQGAVNFMDPCFVQLEKDIDDFLLRIERTTQRLLPSSFVVANQSQMEMPTGNTDNQTRRKRKEFQRQDSTLLTLSSFDSMLEGANTVDRQSKKQHTMNHGQNATLCASPSAVEVDICDDEILQLWKSHN